MTEEAPAGSSEGATWALRHRKALASALFVLAAIAALKAPGLRITALFVFLLGASLLIAEGARDVDDDGLSNRDEVARPHRILVVGAPAYHVYSSASVADTDGDGLNDAEEREIGIRVGTGIHADDTDLVVDTLDTELADDLADLI